MEPVNDIVAIFQCQSTISASRHIPKVEHIVATMKIAIIATLFASASAFSVNKAAFTQVRELR
jgi:hypothetical protein